MKIGNRELIVVGDRVLLKQEDVEERTEVGLYLPQTVVEKEEVQGGRVMLTGPGIPLPESPDDDQPWQSSSKEPRYVPLQAEVGDYALFLKKAAFEVKFEGDKYLIVPHHSILMLIRGNSDVVGTDDMLEGIEGLDDLDLPEGGIDGFGE
ncbi:MAG: co-chaperone GroES family protein [bacterium]|nr:co-chaperone GroES family protein [bacterium]